MPEVAPEKRYTKCSDRHIGNHNGKAIPAYIETESGCYWFDRVAHTDKRGRAPLAQMRNDEVMITPGLIYRKVLPGGNVPGWA